ncbi:hypothetical protein CAP35_03435 [Chitinophagaceae bacterium IBVUCB1]|nr:hypothetical protein CAP35_03435 [Chitinophagaceae bacterium IBVUCB1]
MQAFFAALLLFRILVLMRYILLILTTVFYCSSANAQQAFSEGIIQYDVAIDPPANQEGVVQYKGSYTIIVKGSMVKETLLLDNGYESSLLFNYREKKVYSLKKAGAKHTAIELGWEQIEKRRTKYYGFTLHPLADKKEIAGLQANHASIMYKNGTTADVYYTAQWTPGYIVFDNYPGIGYLLLSFNNKHDDGLTIYFTAKKVAALPVDNADVTIPAHYKIISNKEYEQMKSK